MWRRCRGKPQSDEAVAVRRAFFVEQHLAIVADDREVEGLVAELSDAGGQTVEVAVVRGVPVRRDGEVELVLEWDGGLGPTVDGEQHGVRAHGCDQVVASVVDRCRFELVDDLVDGLVGKPAAASGSVVVLSGVAAAQPVTRSRVVARITPRLVFDARGMAGFTFVEGCVGARTRAMRLPANSPGGPHSRSTD